MLHVSKSYSAHLIAGVPSTRESNAQSEVFSLYGEALRLRPSKSSSTSDVMEWCQRAHDLLVSWSHTDTVAISLWQKLLLPFFLESPFLKRAYVKPRGYAGDYLTIQMMYDAVPGGPSSFAQAVDQWALEQPCPCAVRNRRGLVSGLVQTLTAAFPGRTLSIASLGCGPAAEVFDCLTPTPVHFTLVDIDEEALCHVREKAVRKGAADRLTLIQGNLIKMALGRTNGLPSNQHAFYSLGVIDYFNDELVIRLLDNLHSRLACGGVALLGNFRPGHPNANFFNHALDWPLCLRSEDHLLDLVRRTRFGESAATIGVEAEGIQIFVTCTKS
jgi:extracellular factor (EF) 3-hydroxypalmitic acid methyl ester biosynthesis protein